MRKLSEIDQSMISNKINCFFSELTKKYEKGKYDEEGYIYLLSTFENPKNVKDEDIEYALAWKYGKTRKNFLKNPQYKNIALSFKMNWPDYIAADIRSGDDTFKHWNGKIKTSFISKVFITHLLFPSDIPIVDQHTFRSVRYFLSAVNYNHGIKKIPNTLAEIHTFKEFLHCFSEKKGVNFREFDKYLMMFGKHVAPR